ncbi:unnamed protein product [Adineta steineri]|uniref:Ricin B lectin domain-containing protein n=1 Tax=Adineta steineri TaxID=433720 RepID=A0A814WUU7_9BILA|nr:unnamed protein product [Adineta steineri]
MNYALYLVLLINTVNSVLVNQNQQWRPIHHQDKFFHLQNSKSGKCLDVALDQIYQDGGKVQQWDCHYHSDNQQWFFDHSRLVNKKSGKCLDAPWGWWWAGARLSQWHCHDRVNQKWLDHHGGFKNDGSKKCLDVPNDQAFDNGVQLHQWHCLYE